MLIGSWLNQIDAKQEGIDYARFWDVEFIARFRSRLLLEGRILSTLNPSLLQNLNRQFNCLSSSPLQEG